MSSLTTRTPERAFYIEQYSDEVMPCDGSLASWADWLSRPDPDWNREEAAIDGDRFDATVMRFDTDIVATHTVAGWTFDREPDGAQFLAVRFGRGLGWDADSIIEIDRPAENLREFLEEVGDSDEPQYIAVGVAEPAVVLIYRALPEPHFDIELAA